MGVPAVTFFCFEFLPPMSSSSSFSSSSVPVVVPVITPIIASASGFDTSSSMNTVVANLLPSFTVEEEPKKRARLEIVEVRPESKDLALSVLQSECIPPSMHPLSDAEANKVLDETLREIGPNVRSQCDADFAKTLGSYATFTALSFTKGKCVLLLMKTIFQCLSHLTKQRQDLVFGGKLEMSAGFSDKATAEELDHVSAMYAYFDAAVTMAKHLIVSKEGYDSDAWLMTGAKLDSTVRRCCLRSAEVGVDFDALPLPRMTRAETRFLKDMLHDQQVTKSVKVMPTKLTPAVYGNANILNFKDAEAVRCARQVASSLVPAAAVKVAKALDSMPPSEHRRELEQFATRETGRVRASLINKKIRERAAIRSSGRTEPGVIKQKADRTESDVIKQKKPESARPLVPLQNSYSSPSRPSVPMTNPSPSRSRTHLQTSSSSRPLVPVFTVATVVTENLPTTTHVSFAESSPSTVTSTASDMCPKIGDEDGDSMLSESVPDSFLGPGGLDTILTWEERKFDMDCPPTPREDLHDIAASSFKMPTPSTVDWSSAVAGITAAIQHHGTQEATNGHSSKRKASEERCELVEEHDSELAMLLSQMKKNSVV